MLSIHDALKIPRTRRTWMKMNEWAIINKKKNNNKKTKKKTKGPGWNRDDYRNKPIKSWKQTEHRRGLGAITKNLEESFEESLGIDLTLMNGIQTWLIRRF